MASVYGTLLVGELARKLPGELDLIHEVQIAR
jgi:hypothetical protein